MSKQHFEALARQLRAVRDHDLKDKSAEDAWRSCVWAVAMVAAADNPRFDRARFYAACGLEEAAA